MVTKVHFVFRKKFHNGDLFTSNHRTRMKVNVANQVFSSIAQPSGSWVKKDPLWR